MQAKRATYSVMNVDSDEVMSPMSLPRGSPCGAVHTMPAFDSPVGQSGRFLCQPQQRQEHCYNTPTGAGAAGDDSVRSTDVRYQRGIAAPKKRDETLSTSPRNACARDADSPAICAFRLSPRDSDNGSTQSSNDANQGSSRQQGMNELRSEWSAFTQRIMAVEVTGPRPGPLRG